MQFSRTINEINKFFGLTYLRLFGGFAISGIIGYLISKDITVIRPFITTFNDPRISLIVFVILAMTPVVILKIFWEKLPIRSFFILYPLVFSLLGISLTGLFLFLKANTLIYIFFGVAFGYLQISLAALFSKKDYTTDISRLLASMTTGLGGLVAVSLYGDGHGRQTQVIVAIFAMLRYLYLTKRHTQELRNAYLANKDRTNIDSIRGAGIMYVDFYLIFVTVAKIYMNRGAANKILGETFGDLKKEKSGI